MILKVSRTIADLAGETGIMPPHVMEMGGPMHEGTNEVVKQ